MADPLFHHVTLQRLEYPESKAFAPGFCYNAMAYIDFENPDEQPGCLVFQDAWHDHYRIGVMWFSVSDGGYSWDGSDLLLTVYVSVANPFASPQDQIDDRLASVTFIWEGGTETVSADEALADGTCVLRVSNAAPGDVTVTGHLNYYTDVARPYLGLVPTSDYTVTVTEPPTT